ncbi:MAG: hypothetical protein WBB62_08225 [Rhodococcus sp. (in: high G+C Gram-positive bacteria)]
MTATTRFDPNTPPSFAEDIAEELSEDESPDLLSASAVQRGNALAMTDAAQREARLIIGTTQAGAAQRDVRLSEDRAAAERERAESDAQRGGPTISTELRGDLGRAVSELLRLDDIARQASALIHRASAEVAELDRQMEQRARVEKMDELLAEGWDASAGKRAVPAIVAPLMHWAHHERPVGRPEGYAVDVRGRIAEQHAERNAERVRECLESVEKLLNSATVSILDNAGHAADVLDSAGLSVDATAEDIIEQDSAEVSAAWRAWREAVSEWTDLQSVRRWLAVALSRGFDPKRPLELLSDTDAEQSSWSSQFMGAEVGVQGAHAALAWWLENGRPQAAGIAHIESEA